MSIHTDTINAWLKELASLSGIDELSLNDEGVAAVRFGDKANLIVELPEHDDIVHIYCPICEVPQNDQEKLYRYLLEQNMFGLATCGASFAVDKGTERVILCYSQPISGTDITQFVNIMGNFALVCEKFCEEVPNFGASASDGDMSVDPTLRV